MAVNNRNPRSKTRDINAYQRVQLAISLRAQKLPWEEVALRAGYASRGAAHNAVQAEMQRCISHDIEQMRHEELMMLDQLHASVWPMVVAENAVSETDEPDDDEEEMGSSKRKKKQKQGGPNLWAVDRIIAISERRCKLMGLDRKVDDMPINTVVVREMPQNYFGMPIPATTTTVEAKIE